MTNIIEEKTENNNNLIDYSEKIQEFTAVNFFKEIHQIDTEKPEQKDEIIKNIKEKINERKIG